MNVIAAEYDAGVLALAQQKQEFVREHGGNCAIQVARNFWVLRARGVAIRKTIDTLIATRCIESDYLLLFSDRDFEPFFEHFVLRTAMVDN